MLGKYHEVHPINRQAAERAFSSADPRKICDALIRITFYDSDYKWVQGKCIGFLNSNDLDIKRLAIVCLGHLARIHNKLDLELILPMLEKLKTDKELSGAVCDTLGDIEIFIAR